MKEIHSGKCPIHPNSEECVKFRLNQLKIAVAVVIVRSRPKDVNQSATEFVINLQLSLQNKDNRWKMEYFRLKREVQLLRQQQILLLRSQPTGVTDVMIHRSHEPGERLGSLNLTPPDSQSRGVSLDLQDQNEQVLFLRAYFYLEHQLRAQPEFLEDDVIQQSISTVLRHVDGSIRRNRIDSIKCMESFHNCVRLLDTHHKWNVSILSHRFTEMAARWLHSIRSSDQSGAYSSLLQILADSDFAARLGPLVVEQIVRMQTSISSWQSPDALIPRKIADDFMASSYYFTLLETLIPRLSGAEKQSHVTLLPPIDDRVQVHFPLFAASLMRCVDALQK